MSGQSTNNERVMSEAEMLETIATLSKRLDTMTQLSAELTARMFAVEAGLNLRDSTKSSVSGLRFLPGFSRQTYDLFVERTRAYLEGKTAEV